MGGTLSMPASSEGQGAVGSEAASGTSSARVSPASLAAPDSPTAQGVPDSSPARQAMDKSAEPTPTASAQGLGGNSTVRNNVIRSSRGQSAIILFNVAQDGAVTVEIHDRMGHSVAMLQNGTLAAGQYTLYWNGAADAGGMAASGIYEVRIVTPTYVDRHKMMLVK